MKHGEKVRVFFIATVLLIALVFSYRMSTGDEDIQKKISIGQRFHYETFLPAQGIGEYRPTKPLQYKKYSEARMIPLPRPHYQGVSLESAIEKRRSVRDYSTAAITVNQVSQLLFAGQGITGEIYDQPLRSAPSAGALYPIEIYLVVNNVERLSQGIYHYNVQAHALELLREGDCSSEITTAALRQDALGKANIVLVLSAIFDRTCHKYGDRGFRYVYLEAGHISQNVFLQAVSLGLGSVSVGAFSDDKVNQLFGLDGRKESAVYLMAVGAI